MMVALLTVYFFSQGMFQEASDILSFCKTKFPEHSKLSRVGIVAAMLVRTVLTQRYTVWSQKLMPPW